MSKIKAYLINLDRSKDRLASAEQEFSKHNIDWQRVPALDGKTLTDEQWQNVDRKGYDFCHGKVLNPNEAGCYLSHIKALEMFLDGDADIGLILEDDFQILESFQSLLPKIIEHQKDWDVLTLYSFHSGTPIKQRALDEDHHIVAYMTRQTSALGYFVNRDAAEKMRNHLLPMRVPYDHAFNKAWVYKVKYRGVRPHIIQPQFTTSTIDEINKAERQRLKKPWYRRGSVLLYRTQNEIRRLIYYILRGLFIPRA